MLTLIISIVVMALLPLIFIRGCSVWGRIIYTLIFAFAGSLIGLMVALQIPGKFEQVKKQSYHIVSSGGDLMKIQGKKICFGCEENGKIIQREIDADSIEIIYTSDKIYYLEETNFKNTNHFSLNENRTNIRVFIYNPHQGCGFF